MANRTVRDAQQIHSTNPQFLVEKVIRARIYSNNYWREQCFALTAESVIDKALDLKYIGGTYGPQIPSPFVCLLLKLLQLQPQKEIILEYLTADEFKYLRALAALYVRLTFPSMEVYEVLEPMLNDYRRLRYRNQGGCYTITHMDEFIDDLLTQERVCELILPRLTRRDVLEESEGLAPRISKLEDAMLLAPSALRAGRANGTTLGGDDDNDNDKGDGDGDERGSNSDDSLVHERRERQRRLERAAQVRQKRRAEQERRSRFAAGSGRGRDFAGADAGPASAATPGPAGGDGDSDGDGDDDDAGFASQEGSSDEAGSHNRARFVSRSPSRSVSPDRAGSNAIGGTDRSRSVSKSPHRPSISSSDGYRSRSASRSPDR
ncbi:PRP38-domain-containing protein [Tilletiaria anomala UBC 951]|uniref:Pre-mRNA-splicing factor 38 n=1 Tax=Tilletiaria anomala (strain ATCC 24038 / CBS 436.72 / UBC 951) TaxID=1037660 RepID=A0A066VG41_TILAU|nr:PRP38-domain-containing protein [Tilletiaria anomala UBC 951]KDN40426.1 PRP38-domain-containing protein [Tilletiaria anomala UBC 951]